MIYLSLPLILRVADRVVEGAVVVRDYGMIEAAAARPQATVLGKDAYPTLELKAAALLQSLVVGHPLVDGNMRLGLGAVIAFLGVNGHRLSVSEESAYELVIDVATGTAGEVGEIAARILIESRAAGRR